jgi:hypothetical protein
MPTETRAIPAAEAMHPLAARRILRLALGTALSLWFSQAVDWTFSFFTPVLTLLILSLPLPAPRLKQGVIFIVALVLPISLSMVFLPFLWHARWAGILMIALAMYYTFYYTARGGAAVVGTLMTIGLTLMVTVGSVNSTIIVFLIQTMTVCAVVAMAFVWIAHALLPDPPPDPSTAPPRRQPAVKPDLSEARRNAFRSLMIVLPIALIFLFMNGSPAYTVVMIKVASMGQQATADNSRQMGRSLLESTLWGGLGAVIGWTLLSAWPSLLFYTLLIALAGLLFGRGIFRGPGLHPKFSMWQYAFLTMVVILAPAVLDSAIGGGGVAIGWRLFLFLLIAVYGTVAVAVFDAFFPSKTPKTD